MKKPLLTIATIAAAITLLNADTITWTGDGDGTSWSDSSNWSSLVSPGSSWSDDVVVDGNYTVYYTNQVDLAFTGSLTLKGGAVFKQTVISWPNFPNGTLILENGTFDLSAATGDTALGTVVFNAGENSFIVPNGFTKVTTVVVNENSGVSVASGISSGKLVLNDGASFISTAGDFYIPTNTTFGAVNLSVNTITTGTENQDSSKANITLWGTNLKAERTGAFCGIWGGQYEGVVNFKSGRNSSFTFPNANVTDKATAYNQLFQQGYFTFDGGDLASDSNVWTEHFSVTFENGLVVLSYLEVLDDNRIGSIGASNVSSSSATLTADIDAISEGATVLAAYGTGEITESQILSGAVVAVIGNVASLSISDLTDLSVYNFAFAIVTNGAVAAFKSDSFVASDYDYVWMDGAWLGAGAPPNFEVDKNVLFMNGNFSTGAEISPSNKKMVNVAVTAPTLVNGAVTGTAADALELCNSTYTNTKDNDLNGVAAYGVYNCQRPLNFTTQSGNGVIRRASTYTCYATEEQCGDVYARLFDNNPEDASLRRKVLVDGVEIVEATFAEVFTTNSVATEKTITIGEDLVPLRQLSIMRWEQLPANAAGNWTFKDGARVKLNRNTKIAALTVESEGVEIDLNGYNLKVSSLFVNGEKKKGEFNKDNLSILTGAGSLTIGGPGFSVFVR